MHVKIKFMFHNLKLYKLERYKFENTYYFYRFRILSPHKFFIIFNSIHFCFYILLHFSYSL